MIPVLYYKEHYGSDHSYVIGKLPAWIECEVTEERNGEFFLRGILPAGAQNVDELAIDRIIECASAPKRPPDPDSPFPAYQPMQPFRIRRIWKEADGSAVNIEAHHVSYQLSENIVKPFIGVQDTSIQDYFDLEFNSRSSGAIVPQIDLTYHFMSDIVMLDPVYPNHDKPMSVRAFLGGEDGLISMITGKLGDQHQVMPEPEMDWNCWTVCLMAQRGHLTDVCVSYARNMATLAFETSVDGLVTAVYGWGVWGPTYKDYLAYRDGHSAYQYERIETVDLSSMWESAPSDSAFEAAVEACAQGNATLPTSITVTAVPAALQGVFLCDTIRVIHPGYQISQPAKIVKTVYDPIRERYTAVTIGEIQKGITDTIARMLARGELNELTNNRL